MLRKRDNTFSKRILIKNMKLLGFRNKEDQNKTFDIVINSQGNLSKIASSPLNHSDFDGKVINIKNGFLTPGWIDLHTHIFFGGTIMGVDPDLIGPSTGVLGLVDAGSAGEANYGAFKEFILEDAPYTIKSYLNFGSIGLTAANKVNEFSGNNPIDLNRIKEVVKENPKNIKGIKIRASKVIIGEMGFEYIKLAKSFSKSLNLPLIVHIGEPPALLEDLVENVLGSGDMVTHVFHGKVGGNILSDPIFSDLLLKAKENGVLLDIGHGSASFNYKCAQEGISEGIKPFSISTDLHTYNIEGPVWDLPTVMSKLYTMKLNLKEIIKMVTTNPASFLGLEEWTELKVGSKANFTIFKLKEGDFTFKDSAAIDDSTAAPPAKINIFQGTKFIEPLYSIYNGNIQKANSRYLKQNLS